MTIRSALLVPALALSAAGCIHAFPAVATPGPAEPAPSEAPVPPGYGRIYVDVVDGPTQVQVVEVVEGTEKVGDQDMETETLEVQSVCRSPCVLDLKLGQHTLAFPMRGSGGVDLADVTASSNPTIYRRSLGWRQSGGAGFALGVLGAAFGGVSLVTGAALLPVGLAKDRSGLILSGEITLGVGALLTAAGIWTIVKNPVSEQAGAGAQYALPESDGPR